MTRITPETMQLTREHFASLHTACATECAQDANDPVAYAARCHRLAAQALAGDFDHSFTFLQRAHYLQTGECVALLP